jgi:hypothetical protein
MYKKSRKRLILSSFLILTGIALFLKYFGLIPSALPGYLFTWKTFILLLGIFFVITQKEKTAGIVLAGVGFYFLIPEIWNINPLEVVLFWPVLFVVAGFIVWFSGS